MTIEQKLHHAETTIRELKAWISYVESLGVGEVYELHLARQRLLQWQAYKKDLKDRHRLLEALAEDRWEIV